GGLGSGGGGFLGGRLNRLAVLGLDRELLGGLGDPLDELRRHRLAHVLAAELASREVVPELAATESTLENPARVVAHLLTVDLEAEAAVLKAVEFGECVVVEVNPLHLALLPNLATELDQPLHRDRSHLHRLPVFSLSSS